MSETLTVATIETIELDKVVMRTEHDLLGDTEVPNTAYWGVHTKQRSRISRSRACRSATFPSSSTRWPWSSRRRRGPTSLGFLARDRRRRSSTPAS